MTRERPILADATWAFALTTPTLAASVNGRLQCQGERHPQAAPAAILFWMDDYERRPAAQPPAISPYRKHIRILSRPVVRPV